QGFCTMCGACEAACPVHAIKIEEGKLQSVYDCAQYLDHCSICYDVCPHTEALLVETSNMGCYREVLLGQAVERRVGAGCGGGVVAALLTHALEADIIDSAVFSGTKLKVPLELEPLVSSASDDLLSATEIQFFPSAVAKTFRSAVLEHRKQRIAFVGVPCHVLALRKLEAWQHRLAENLKIVIGLFCLWTFSSSRLFEYLAKKFNIKASEIQRISLGNEYNIHTRKGITHIPLQEIKPNILNRCRSCIDFSSELADISIGGAHPLTDWSTVIIRTRRGEDFFNNAVKHKVIKTKEIEEAPEVLSQIIGMATSKREAALKEVKKRKRLRRPIPPAMESFVDGGVAEV
ncbi:MAG: Coenzyme F420 hydrogenase/dehydrogenase, beta subunit C-terminal domain, partial [Candidatus Bathyarchaeota archaeon]